MEYFYLDETYTIDIEKLKADLKSDGCELVTISPCGELVIDNLTNGPDYAYRREVWQARDPGTGVNNAKWGDLPGGYEFCRSIKLAATENPYYRASRGW